MGVEIGIKEKSHRRWMQAGRPSKDLGKASIITWEKGRANGNPSLVPSSWICDIPSISDPLHDTFKRFFVSLVCQALFYDSP